MAIRMSGMISGLDTDSIIKELMSAKSAKKTKLVQQKTKVEWKQEMWSDLNTKLYKLYTDQLSKVRLAGNYATKKVTSSNENMVTATASTSAGSGSHTIEIKQLASAQYITGGSKTGLKGSSTLKDAGMDVGNVIKITSGTGSTATTKSLEITATTTINDLVNTMKTAGLTASFDEAQGRFFITGKNSGEANAFSIQTFKLDTAESAAFKSASEALKSAAGITDSQISTYQSLLEDVAKKESAYNTAKDKVTAWTELQEAKQNVTDAEESFYTTAASKTVIAERLDELKQAAAGNGSEEAKKVYGEIETAVKKKYYELDTDGKVKSPETFSQAAINSSKASIMSEATAYINKGMNDGTLTFDTVAERNQAIQDKYTSLLNDIDADESTALAKKTQELYNKQLDTAMNNSATIYPSTTEGTSKVKTEVEALKADGAISTAMNNYKTARVTYANAVNNATAVETGQLSAIGLADIKVDIVNGKPSVVSSGGPSDFQLKTAVDSTIILDGATITNAGNTFSAAGVTYNLKNAQEGTTINVSVTNDTQAVYDMVKNFVKSYNEILTEMNTLYNATSAKGYEPLTDEQKEVMSDKQIEIWEDKIKDSLLRRDDKLGGVINTLRTSLQGSISVNGKNYSLASFGIVTGSYTEKGLLHIQGDSDDATYSDKTNKLKEALSSDPDAVANALAGLTSNLYSAMQDKMKSSSVSSALTFYNDKEMKSQVTDYTKQIKVWETRLQDMEDRYYKQYSAMETALAKLQSSSNSLSGLFGN